MTKTPPLPKSATDELWMRMASRYGHAWVSQYGASPAGIAAAEWRSTLAGLSPQQVRVGFENDTLRAADWPPSSTRFRSMCLDMPELSEVSHRLQKALDPHRKVDFCPFDRLVMQFLDTYRWRNSSCKESDRLLRDAYGMARDHVMAGGELPPEPVALIEKPAEKPHKPASPEVVAEHISKLNALLNVPDEDAGEVEA